MTNAWYSFYPGDYARDTADLSLAQHGAYRLLLDHCYATQAPLPIEKIAHYRICRAFTKSDRAAVDFVVRKFFELEADGFHSRRADREIEKQLAMTARRSDSGKRGADARWKGHSNSYGEAKGRANGQANAEAGNEGVPPHPQPHPHPESKPESNSDQTEQQKLAAAFAVFEELGFTEPFGSPEFQQIWANAYHAMEPDASFTEAMERTAQRAESTGVKVPPLFFKLKRKIEEIEVNNNSRRTPL